MEAKLFRAESWNFTGKNRSFLAFQNLFQIWIIIARSRMTSISFVAFDVIHPVRIYLLCFFIHLHAIWEWIKLWRSGCLEIEGNQIAFHMGTIPSICANSLEREWFFSSIFSISQWWIVFICMPFENEPSYKSELRKQMKARGIPFRMKPIPSLWDL